MQTIAIAFVLFCVITQHSDVYACSCEPVTPPTPLQLLDSALAGQLVYVGTVTGADSTSFDSYRIYEIEVETTIGGNHADVQFLSTGMDEASCGIYLEIGSRYTFHPITSARPVEETGSPYIGLCGRRVFEPDFISRTLRDTAVQTTTWANMKVATSIGTMSDR